MSDKRKQSLYFPEAMLKEIQAEANRQDRSLSWIVQQAWRVARVEIKRFPSVNDVMGEDGGDGVFIRKIFNALGVKPVGLTSFGGDAGVNTGGGGGP